MEITSKTNEIKWLCKSIKNNFLRIGKLLIEVRTAEAYKPTYESFNQYLESEDFIFGKSMAYKIMRVFDEFGAVERVPQLSFRKLVQLVYVSDKEVRHQLVQQAITLKPVEIEPFKQKLQRVVQRQNKTVTPTDSKRDKCVRQLNQITEEVDSAETIISALKLRVSKVLTFASEFDDPEIKALQHNLGDKWRWS